MKMSDVFQRKPVMGQFDAYGNLMAFEDLYGQRSDGQAMDADYAAAVVGAAGGVPASVVIDAQGVASANVTALQRSLDAGGTVSLLRPGTIWINDTLIYDSDTQIVLGPQTTIKMVAGIRKPLLRSAAYDRMVQAPVAVTLTWVSGMTFSVAWAGHGRVKGDAIWINGATLQPQYKGVYTIETVTDANNFVVRAKRLPAAVPVGDVFAVVATANTVIDGGVWDYNYDGTFAATPMDRFAMQHIGVYQVFSNNMTGRDAAKYLHYWSAHLDCGFNNLHCEDTNSDGVKVHGPGYGFRGKGITGTVVDDGVSFQPEAPPVSFPGYSPYFGDVINCQIADIDVRSSTAVAVFYPSSLSSGYMDDCGFINVAGSAPSGLKTVT
jgi:hypothetical protein